MMNKKAGTFLTDDVILLLNDITGLLEPKPAEEREKLIQNGVHYSEMLPLEYKPSEQYLTEYYRVLDSFAAETADAVMAVSEKIYAAKGEKAVLVSLARAGTPVGILIKRYLGRKYNIIVPHYTISIVRGRGIDKNAMKIILSSHSPVNIQFVDGWTGKGAILGELAVAIKEFAFEQRERSILAVLADPANITDMCGTHEDIPIASSFLNSTVCGLMSRTVIRPGIADSELHGVAFYNELRSEDRTYEFIERIENYFDILDLKGTDEVREIAEAYNINDINFIKPGIGEATRVLLRRIPEMILIAEDVQPHYVTHLIQLAEEKQVPVVHYPLHRYKACGIIKALTPDL
jgi:hypothetical protein